MGNSRQVTLEIIAQSYGLDSQLSAASQKVQKFANEANAAGQRAAHGIEFELPRGIGGLAKGVIGLHAIAAGLDLATAAAQAFRGDTEATLKTLEAMPLGIGHTIKAAHELALVLSGIEEETKAAEEYEKKSEERWKGIAAAAELAHNAIRSYNEESQKDRGKRESLGFDKDTKALADNLESVTEKTQGFNDKLEEQTKKLREHEKEILAATVAPPVSQDDPRVKALAQKTAPNPLSAYYGSVGNFAAAQKQIQEQDNAKAKETESKRFEAQLEALKESEGKAKSEAEKTGGAVARNIIKGAEDESHKRAAGFNLDALENQLKAAGNDLGGEIVASAHKSMEHVFGATTFTELRAALSAAYQDLSKTISEDMKKRQKEQEEAAKKQKEIADRHERERMDGFEKARARIEKEDEITKGRKLAPEDAGFLHTGTNSQDATSITSKNTTDLVKLQEAANRILSDMARDKSTAQKLQLVGFEK